jgi:phosphatidylglycerol---prolipoprotein diacylglyceryl transferase
MLPYFAPPAWTIGPVTVEAFGIAVAVAMWCGTWLFEDRVAMLRLDRTVAMRFSGWVIAGGIVGAHLFSVIFYFPERLRDDPWLLLRVWEPISSFGGMLGGLVAAFLFFRRSRHAQGSTVAEQTAFLDALAFAFPFALAIGRFGCALAHDHPGRVTTFPLSISLQQPDAQLFIATIYRNAGLSLPFDAASQAFFDLGLLECVYLAAVVLPVFWMCRRSQRTGFFLWLFPALYLPMRFFLDTLRVADVRYAGLTPAQWVAAAIVPTLPFFVVRRRTLRYAAGAALILLTGWACTAGAR